MGQVRSDNLTQKLDLSFIKREQNGRNFRTLLCIEHSLLLSLLVRPSYVGSSYSVGADRAFYTDSCQRRPLPPTPPRSLQLEKVRAPI